MKSLEEQFIALREAWFDSQLRRNPHEREWETEEQEKYREQLNKDTKELYDQDTQALLRGEDRPVSPTCTADIRGGE